MTEAKSKVVHYTKIGARLFGDEAPGTSIRVLISDDADGAPVYNMRMIEIESGGHTPHHIHPYEHENFVLEGQGQVVINGKTHDIEPGVVIFVPPNAKHQYRNIGDTKLRFLCSVPVERLRTIV